MKENRDPCGRCSHLYHRSALCDIPGCPCTGFESLSHKEVSGFCFEGYGQWNSMTPDHEQCPGSRYPYPCQCSCHESRKEAREVF